MPGHPQPSYSDDEDDYEDDEEEVTGSAGTSNRSALCVCGYALTEGG